MTDYKLVPAELIDRFPEINPSNYDHDDACTLNAWGVELVLAAVDAPAVQGAVGEGVPDYINDAIDNLAQANYEMSYAGYLEREKDTALIRAYIACTGQPAAQQRAPDVSALVGALERSVAGFDALSGMASLAAGARNYARQKALELNANLPAHRSRGEV